MPDRRLSQRMARRHHDREPVRAHLMRREPRRQVGPLHEAEVRAAVEDRRRHLRRVTRRQRDRRLRVAGPQHGQPAGQQVLRDRHGRRDAQHGVAARPQRRDARVQGRGGVDRGLRPPGHQLAVRREARAARRPLDQRDAKLALKPPDPGARRRLGDPVLGRGQAEAAEAGDGQQQVKRHQVGHPGRASS